MRRILKALLILVIGLPVIAAVGYWYLQQQIAQAGISNLQLDVNRLTLTSASFNRVRFALQQGNPVQKGGAVHQIDLQNVELNWHWPQAFKPALQQVTLGPGIISLASPEQTPTETTTSALRLPSQWQLPDWLPQHIGVTNTRLLLPCPAGLCQLQLNGYLTYHHSAEPGQSLNQPAQRANGFWQSQLVVSSDPSNSEHPLSALTIDARYLVSPQPTLELTIQQAQQIGLSLKQQINPDSQLAVTELVLALSPPTAANLAILQQWGFELPPAWVSQFQQPVQLYSRLNWQLPAGGDLSNLLHSHDLDAMIIARAPDPFYLPQLGLIQGELNAELSLKNQVVERWQINANGSLSEPELPATANDYGITLNPVQFQLTAKANDVLNLAALPLQLKLSSSGENSFTLDSEMAINLTASPRVDIQQAKLTAAVAQLRLPDDTATLSKLQLNARLSGYWQADEWQVVLTDNSTVSGAVQAEALSTPQFALTINESRFSGTQAGLTELTSTVNAKLNKLSQSAVLNQNWQWQAQLDGTTSNLMLEGQLSNDAGLTLAHQLTYQPATNSLLMNWQMAEIFLLAGNPLAATLSDWPELLTLNRGKLTASGDLTLAGNEFSSTSQLQLGDIAGIYDRSLFSGLSAKIDMELLDDQLQMATTNLQLNRLNHGFELGPLNLAATTTLPLANPQQIKLNLQQAELQVMQGMISANNQNLDFSQPANQLVLQLQQIDLASLLQQHPSNDLVGNGKLSGTVPLTLGNKGISVSDGSIAAEAPGGRLQYRSASTSAMANTNSSMKLVFDALDNFHYTVLSSDISYNTSGKLVLGLKLHGSNPNLQQGRAINLNVNLEEDLPALITSLQLTNKLNDVITQRVQQYLKRQQAAAAANGDKP